MAADDIRAMSDALAADPSSQVFLALGEALRRRGDLAHAWRVASRGVERHGQLAAAHDLLGRVAADLAEWDRAENAWETALRLDPTDFGPHKGLGFLRYQQGRHDEAMRHLTAARDADPEDRALGAALTAVRLAMQSTSQAPPPAAPAASVAPIHPFGDAPPAVESAHLFDAALQGTSQVALLLDGDGLVAAGQYLTGDGEDLGAAIGAQLSGVSDEAERAMRHFGLGRWTRIVFETEAAVVAMAPAGEGMLLVAAPREVPLGFLRRTLESSLRIAQRFLGGGA